MYSFRRQLLICLLGFSFPVSVWSQADTIRGLIRQPNAVHLLIIGDWGDQGSAAQRKVASAMEVTAKQLGLSFVISTGDNFYPSGVTSETDSQWQKSYESVYRDSSLFCPWLVALGNHDYQSNPDAQVSYSLKSSRWTMPARYFDTTVLTGTDSLLLIVIDTDPLERWLRKSGTAIDSVAAYAERQMKWLDQQLLKSKARWKFVIGHHPIHTGGARRHNRRVRLLRRLLAPIFLKYKVDFYLSGHEHQLEYLKPKGSTHYFISGAGSETRHVGWLKRHRKFAARKKGFLCLSVSDNEVMAQFISDEKKLLYKKEIAKILPLEKEK